MLEFLSLSLFFFLQPKNVFDTRKIHHTNFLFSFSYFSCFVSVSDEYFHDFHEHIESFRDNRALQFTLIARLDKGFPIYLFIFLFFKHTQARVQKLKNKNFRLSRLSFRAGMRENLRILTSSPKTQRNSPNRFEPFERGESRCALANQSENEEK